MLRMRIVGPVLVVAMVTACAGHGKSGRSAISHPTTRPSVSTRVLTESSGQEKPARTGHGTGLDTTAGSWRIVKVVTSGGLGFTAVTATSRAGAWAFTYNSDHPVTPQAWRLTSSGWIQASFPGRRGERVDVAGSSGPANVWAFTSDNRAIRWNGQSWAVVRGFPGRYVSGAAVVSPRDVWVFDQRYAPGHSHDTWHYNGRSWSRSAQARGLANASATSAGDIWAYGAELSPSSTVIAHWNGSSWRRFDVRSLLPPPTMYCQPDLDAIYAVSASDAWAVGSAFCQDVSGPSALLHYAGGSWHRVANLGTATALALLPDGHGGLWIPVYSVQVLPGAILHYSGGKVTTTRLPIQPGHLSLVQGASAPNGTAAFAVGSRLAKADMVMAIVLEYRT